MACGSIVFFILEVIFPTKYTVLNSEKGSIYIIRNKKYDAILKEIEKRRKIQWKQWYGSINYDNDPSEEIKKFEWLFGKGVISLNELEAVSFELSQENSVNKPLN